MPAIMATIGGSLTYLGRSHTENGNPGNWYAGSPELALDLATPPPRRAPRAGACDVRRRFDRVMHMGSPRRGFPADDRSGRTHGHAAGHEALLALERGDIDRASAIYFERTPARAAAAAAPLNAVTLTAFRCCGGCKRPAIPCRSRHGTTSPIIRNTGFQEPGNAFIDVHMAMLAAMTGNVTALEHAWPISTSGAPAANCRQAPWCRRSAVRRALSPTDEQDYGRLRQHPRTVGRPTSCGSAAATRSAR